MKPSKGVYETIYGNAVAYLGGKSGRDLDMLERVPVEMIDFSKRIRDLEDGE